MEEHSVIRKFGITATDGKSYSIRHYNLSAIIAVGYKVNSKRAVQFRKWATGIIKEYTIKAYVMDDEHLKNNSTILGKQYFEEQLGRIREIRLSERKFYQKITDIYATSIDYDIMAQVNKQFFATVQNKLHCAPFTDKQPPKWYIPALIPKKQYGANHMEGHPNRQNSKI